MVDYLLSINMNEKNFSHFIAEKNYLLHNNIVQQHFQHKINILSRGNPTNLNNYGNSKGVLSKSALGGEVWIFSGTTQSSSNLELTL